MNNLLQALGFGGNSLQPTYDTGLQMSDDPAMSNTQMHQRLRQLMMLQQLMQQRPQMQNMLGGLSPQQYPALQMGQQQQQQQNPLAMMYLMSQARNNLMG